MLACPASGHSGASIASGASKDDLVVCGRASRGSHACSALRTLGENSFNFIQSYSTFFDSICFNLILFEKLFAPAGPSYTPPEPPRSAPLVPLPGTNPQHILVLALRLAAITAISTLLTSQSKHLALGRDLAAPRIQVPLKPKICISQCFVNLRFYTHGRLTSCQGYGGHMGPKQRM